MFNPSDPTDIRSQKSEYEGRQEWTFLLFLGDKQQQIIPTRPDRTRLHQIKPDESTVNQTCLTEASLTGTNELIKVRLRRVTVETATSLWSSQAWSGWTWSNNLSSSLPSEEWRGRGRVYWIRGKKEADWSTNSKTPPTCCHPLASYCLPTSFAKTERTLLPLVTTASGRKGCPPLPHWSVLTRQLSVTQQWPIRLQYSTCGTFWKRKKRNKQKENEDDRGDQPIRWPH